MTISDSIQQNSNASRKYEKLIKQPQMQLGTSVTGTQTDADASANANAIANANASADANAKNFVNFNKHFGNGHATTDRTMLLPLEDAGGAASNIVTYKGKSNGNGYGNAAGNGNGSVSLEFNGSPTSSMAGGNHLAGGGGGLGSSSEAGGWMCHCCGLIARRCFGFNVRRCVFALLAITVVSIFYYTHYVDTGVFNG